MEVEVKKEPEDETSAEPLDKETLSAVLQFLKKNNLKVEYYLNLC